MTKFTKRNSRNAKMGWKNHREKMLNNIEKATLVAASKPINKNQRNARRKNIKIAIAASLQSTKRVESNRKSIKKAIEFRRLYCPESYQTVKVLKAAFRNLKKAQTVVEINRKICNGVCEICKRLCRIHRDHCHRTGKSRGGLCQKCNLGLGLFNDNTALLRAAVKYLERFIKRFPREKLTT